MVPEKVENTATGNENVWKLLLSSPRHQKTLFTPKVLLEEGASARRKKHHHHRNNRQVHPFCSAAASVAKRSKTYLKINVAVFVHVERPEDVVAEFFGISRREEHFVHIYEFCRRQLAVWTILLQRWEKEKKDSFYIRNSFQYFEKRKIKKISLW